MVTPLCGIFITLYILVLQPCHYQNCVVFFYVGIIYHVHFVLQRYGLVFIILIYSQTNSIELIVKPSFFIAMNKKVDKIWMNQAS